MPCLKCCPLRVLLKLLVEWTQWLLGDYHLWRMIYNICTGAYKEYVLYSVLYCTVLSVYDKESNLTGHLSI